MGSPLAYFLTWRTYGTWLPGDERGWINNDNNLAGHPVGSHDSVLHDRAEAAMRSKSFLLNGEARQTVDLAIAGVCAHKKWTLIARSARSNHVHVVLSCNDSPEKAMNTLKAWATRRLRETDEVGPEQDVWARHGSTIWLWTAEQVERKRDYVMRPQDNSEQSQLKRR